MKYLLLTILAVTSVANARPTMYMNLCRGLTGGQYVQFDVGSDNIPFCKFDDAVISAQTLGNYFWYKKTDAALKSYLENNSTCDGVVEAATALTENGEKLSMSVCVYAADTLRDDSQSSYKPMIEAGTLSKTSKHGDNKKLSEALLELFP